VAEGRGVAGTRVQAHHRATFVVGGDEQLAASAPPSERAEIGRQAANLLGALDVAGTTRRNVTPEAEDPAHLDVAEEVADLRVPFHFGAPEADEEELAIDPAVVGSTDTSERIILVVDEEGQRRNETVAIITQILPNAVIEVANDPEEALEMMEEGDFDTFVVNFLMPGYSSSPFVKAVANHPEHPLLIGFAADKMSDAVDPKKGLKIIPLKRLFDLDTSNSGENAEGGEAAEE
jgi:CheY-like chemotaxis protein